MLEASRPSRRFAVPTLIALLAASLAACSETTGPEGDATVTLSVVAGAPAGAASVGPAFALTQTAGGDELVLDRVAVVLREIELERVDAECEEAADEDDCEEFEAGPVLLDLSLDGGVQHVVAVDVPPGAYDELEFDIHKPEDDGDDGTADQAFLQTHPNFRDVSIRVEGSFNGIPFVFTQDLNEEQEIEFADPFTVEAGAPPTNVTLRLDLATWFVTPGGALVDPSTANKGEPNEELVEENIKRSIEAFEDDDEDGEEDDDS